MNSRAYDLVAAAEQEVDSNVKQRLLSEAIRQLDSNGPSSSDEWYALGYAWYLLPIDAPERKERALDSLRRAIELEPKHKFALLYLAHLLFDDRQYLGAYEILISFGADDFASLGQGWRDVKRTEMVLVCVLEMRAETLLLDALKALLARVAGEDVDQLPAPVELFESLKRLLSSSAPQ